jgi:hypothetical protein
MDQGWMGQVKDLWSRDLGAGRWRGCLGLIVQDTRGNSIPLGVWNLEHPDVCYLSVDWRN